MAAASPEVLEAILSEAPPKGSVWRHYKEGRLYMVLDAGVLETSLEPMVFYKSLEDGVRWLRSFGEWFEIVRHEGREVPRFIREE